MKNNEFIKTLYGVLYTVICSIFVGALFTLPAWGILWYLFDLSLFKTFLLMVFIVLIKNLPSIKAPGI